MNWWWIVLAVYAATVCGAAGALLADERRAGDWPVGLADWLYWAASFVVASVLWPLIKVLWGSSRPAPPQPRGHHGQR